MFRLSEYEASAALIELLETSATVRRDGCIWFDGDREKVTRWRNNACDLYLYWSMEHDYGIQLVKYGCKPSRTCAEWSRYVHHSEQAASHIADRKRDVRASFPDQSVKFKVIGWRPHIVKFWEIPKGAMIIGGRDKPTITPLPVRLLNGKRNHRT